MVRIRLGSASNTTGSSPPISQILWTATAAGHVRSCQGHRYRVLEVALSPDSAYIATISEENNSVILWDAATGRFIHQVKRYSNDGSEVSMSWSPDSVTIATWSCNHSLLLWDVVTWETNCSFEGEGGLLILEWSPKSHAVATVSSGQEAGVWDIVSGTVNRIRLGRVRVTSAAWSPDGSVLALVSEDWGCVSLWDAATHCLYCTLMMQHRFNICTSVLYRSPVKKIAYSSDSRALVTHTHDMRILWDVVTGDCLHILGGHCVGNSTVWGPDSDTLTARIFHERVIVCDALTGRVVYVLCKHAGRVNKIAWDRSGRMLASCSDDRTVIIWNVLGCKEPAHILKGHSAAVDIIAWSPDSCLVASASADSIVIVWDCVRGEARLVLGGHSAGVHSVSWSPDCSKLVTGSSDGTAIVWETVRGQKVHKLAGHTGRVNCVTWSPRGTMIASGSDDKTVRLWDVAAGEAICVFADVVGICGGCAEELVWSPDSFKLAVNCLDSHIILGVACRNVLRHLEVFADLSCMAWSTDSSMVAAGTMHLCAELWDAESGKHLCTVGNYSGSLNSVVWDPDDSFADTHSCERCSQAWDANRRCIVRDFKGLADNRETGGCSAGGTQSAKGPKDMAVVLWDNQTIMLSHVLEGYVRVVVRAVWGGCRAAVPPACSS